MPNPLGDKEAWKREVRQALRWDLPERHPDRISADAAAELLEMNRAYLMAWLTKGQIPSADLVRRYCRVFKRPVREVIAITGHEPDMTDDELTEYVVRHEPQLIREAVSRASEEAIYEAVSGWERLMAGLRALETEFHTPVLPLVELEGGLTRRLSSADADRLLEDVREVLGRIQQLEQQTLRVGASHPKD